MWNELDQTGELFVLSILGVHAVVIQKLANDGAILGAHLAGFHHFQQVIQKRLVQDVHFFAINHFNFPLSGIRQNVLEPDVIGVVFPGG